MRLVFDLGRLSWDFRRGRRGFACIAISPASLWRGGWPGLSSPNSLAADQERAALRNILLYGSVGSGKTTLARIYAMALNCDSPDKDGSPCLRCSSCKKIGEEGDPLRFTELDAPTFEMFDEFKETLNSFVRPPTLGRPRMIFFDEAHSIRRLRNGYDFLLKLVEEPPPGIVFCFATTEFDQISKALRSRLLQMEIRPLGLELGTKFLRNIANTEGIHYEDEALALLVNRQSASACFLLRSASQASTSSFSIC